MRRVIGLVVLAGVAVSASADTVRLVEVMRTNVSAATGVGNAWFIGKNVSAVAWDGTDLYVGGQSFDASGSAIAKVRPQVGSTSGSYLLSGAFGTQATTGTRGVQDISVRASDGLVGVATDFGSNNVNGIRIFNSAGAAQGNSSFANRGNGVHFDPVDGRLTALGLGSGRVFKFNDNGSTYNDGVKNWDSAAGPIIFLNSSTHRDLTMDASGNLVYRPNNAIHRANRNPDGLSYAAASVVRPNAIDNVNGQNIEHINGGGSLFSDFNLFSDRVAVTSGQALANVVKGITSGGAAVTLEFDFLDAFGDAPTGNGFYDFSYHAASQTVAVSDFAANQVYIFRVVPAPGAAGLLAGAGLIALRRRR